MFRRRFLMLFVAVSLCHAGETGWDAKAAASYLDGRAEWWATWKQSSRDHGTYCVSCHTAVPYALSRQALRGRLEEAGPVSAERALTANVAKRVAMWEQVAPFYLSNTEAPNRSAESRGTEAVLNALILASSGADEGAVNAAFKNLWAAQIGEGADRGGFLWLDFHNRPWEADDSQYYGSALAAVAIGMRPAEVRRAESLNAYLRRGFDSQSAVNQLVVLWASAKLPWLLGEDRKAALRSRLEKAQQADGGWSLASLAGPWKRRDGTELEQASDGYATGLAAYAMEQAGVAGSDALLGRALAWLKKSQSAVDGRWLAHSMNKKRDPDSDVGKFMSDAATGYAVLALTGSK